MLDALDLRKCIVTIDAMGCQTDIAEKIRENHADYILASKKSYKLLCQKIKDWFDDLDNKGVDVTKACYSLRYGKYITGENAHGRNEKREYFVVVPLWNICLKNGKILSQ